MPTVVPSQIVEYIDQVFTKGGSIWLDSTRCGALNALVALVRQLPNGLLPSDAAAYAQLVRCVETIGFSVRSAESQDQRSRSNPPLLPPDPVHKGGLLAVIRDVLAACPDDIVPQQNREFDFIKDADIRTGLLQDLAMTRSALLNEEWKAATVIAGSIVEALLLWAIKQRVQATVGIARESTVSKGKLSKKPPSDPEQWSLHDYIEIAAELGVIEEHTAQQARIAKDFRNLIHPGRSLRKQQACNRGTALTANAAVEMVARDVRA